MTTTSSHGAPHPLPPVASDDEVDPIDVFVRWHDAAERGEPGYADAATLATADEDGWPSARIVLARSNPGGWLTFFTNLESEKGRALVGNPRAELCFHWKSLARQVRVRGEVALVGDEEADEYFAARPRGSQVGAWISRQSRPLDSHPALMSRYQSAVAAHGDQPIPRPPYWGGFRLIPNRWEFWSEGEHRLHNRLVYVRDEAGWRTQRLHP